MDGTEPGTRAAQRRLNKLARKIGPHIQRLAQTLTATELPAPMTAHQQALLWTFAIAADRSDERANAASDPALQHHLAELSQAERNDTAAAEAIGQLRALLQPSNPQTRLSAVSQPLANPYPLADFFEQLVAIGVPKLRRSRGAYFTPYPLVQFIVRSVDHLLRQQLGVDSGLLVQQTPLCVVDPACGSGIFLLGVLRQLRQLLGTDKSPAETTIQHWLQTHRLVGIDVMPASCGAAQLLIERELSHDIVHENAERTRAHWAVRCGNPLSEVDLCEQLFAHHIPIIVGNPPYNNFGRNNRDPWIIDQLDVYKRGLKEKKLNLDDDFIKFVRWAEYWVDRAGRGVVALVTNNTYLSGLTHRQMRASLGHTFDQIYVLDLHGNSKKRETAPGGLPDENVFAIQQGVAIGLFVKTSAATETGRLMHADLWGTRDQKLETLSRTDVSRISWQVLEPERPNHFFVPRPGRDDAEYRSWPGLHEIFGRYVSGVQTKRDTLFVGFKFHEVESRVRDFLRRAEAGDYDGDVPGWLRAKSRGVAFCRDRVRPYMVAPFDVRWVYYEPQLLGRARYELLQNMDGENVALAFMRQTTNPPPYDHFLVTSTLVSDRVFYSAHGAPFVAPLLIRRGGGARVNLCPEFLKQLARRVGADFELSENGALHSRVDAHDILHWIYAVVHDQDYREQYYEQLCVGFPRIPWPQDREQFEQLSRRGERLAGAHLNAASRESNEAVATAQRGPVELERGYPRWKDGQLALSRGFVWPEMVESQVWHARIGGYAVLPRWLKKRQGRQLDDEDLTQLQRIISALQQ
jgi:predicted helicase